MPSCESQRQTMCVNSPTKLVTHLEVIDDALAVKKVVANNEKVPIESFAPLIARLAV